MPAPPPIPDWPLTWPCEKELQPPDLTRSGPTWYLTGEVITPQHADLLCLATTLAWLRTQTTIALPEHLVRVDVDWPDEWGSVPDCVEYSDGAISKADNVQVIAHFPGRTLSHAVFAAACAIIDATDPMVLKVPGP